MDKQNLSLDLLRQRREHLGLTPDEVIQKLKLRSIDISVKTLYGYENGVGTPKVNTFIALCDIYGITDILGAFGYKSSVALACGSSEWSVSQYNDFFEASLLDKILLLIKHGVPSFSGYESQLSDCFPQDASAANFNRLYDRFTQLDEAQQSQAFFALDEITKKHQPFLSYEETELIKKVRMLPSIRVVSEIVDTLLNASQTDQSSHTAPTEKHA